MAEHLPALQVVWTRRHVPAGRFELTDPAGASVRLSDDARGWPAWVDMLPPDGLATMRWWAEHWAAESKHEAPHG